jgi:uncharacterized protein YraI
LPTPEVYEGIEVELRVIERAWLRVMVDGEKAFEGILEKGAERAWRGSERISLRCGNAGGVEVTVNGEYLGLLGGRGQVVDMEWAAGWVPTPMRTVTPTSTPTKTLTPSPTNIPTWTPIETPTLTRIATSTPTPTPYAVVLAEVLNVRSGPGIVYDVIGKLEEGSQIPIKAQTEEGTWYQIVTPRYRRGWIYGDLVKVIGYKNGIPVMTAVPPTPDISPPTIPVLVYPPNGSTVPQNNNPKCDAKGYHGIIWFFDWEDSYDPSGIWQYELYVMHRGAKGPLIHTYVTESEYTYDDSSACGYIADKNLSNWTWKVRAQDRFGNWSEWSDIWIFNVEPLKR